MDAMYDENHANWRFFNTGLKRAGWHTNARNPII
jgi:hypothetical protein